MQLGGFLFCWDFIRCNKSSINDTASVLCGPLLSITHSARHDCIRDLDMGHWQATSRTMNFRFEMLPGCSFKPDEI